MADKDIEETADELFNGTSEAPGSITARVWYRGVSLLITNRDEKKMVKPLIQKMMAAVDWMLDEANCKPSWKDEPVKDEETKKDPDRIQETTIKAPSCPKCGGEMVQRTAKKTGNKFWGCSGYPECDGIVDSKKG